MKRTDYISWDEYFMGLAILTSKRSKDPSTQVGACIVSPDNKILSVGYNGFPRSRLPYVNMDNLLPWAQNSSIIVSPNDPLNVKYWYVVHAEANAILNANTCLQGARIYLTWFPCSDCAKLIIQAGITEVIFLHDRSTEKFILSMKASRLLFDATGVKYKKFYSKDSRDIKIEF